MIGNQRDLRDIILDVHLDYFTNATHPIWLRTIGGKFFLQMLRKSNDSLLSFVKPQLDEILKEDYNDWEANINEVRTFVQLISDLSVQILNMEENLGEDKSPTETWDLGAQG